jgi:hypothetical protein
MSHTVKTTGTRRVLSAVALATLWLARAGGGFAAEVAPAAPDNAPAVPVASRTESKLPPVYAYRAEDLETLRRGFATPPREAGPWVYWFWWNNVVSSDEIARELDEMAAAGIAGAELRIVTFNGWGGPPLQGMDAASLERIGHRQIKYLSDECLDTMEFTCAKAQQLGLRLAINMGMGWPPGGTWITAQHQSKSLSCRACEVQGGTNFEGSVSTDGGMAFAWKLGDQPKTVDRNSFQDLSPQLQRQRDRAVLRWNVPEGRWLIGLFSVGGGGQCDKGEGSPLDPGSREAVLFHLDYIFSRLDPKLGRFYGTTLVDVASDSWEYDGGDYWTPAILEAFPRQAGYDLRGRMYALLGYGPDAALVLREMNGVGFISKYMPSYRVSVAQFRAASYANG